MPEGAVYVGRPTRWGNPWHVGDGWVDVSGHMSGPGAGRYDVEDLRYYELPLPGSLGLTAEQAVDLYREDLEASLADPQPYQDELRAALAELSGRDLACWCPLDQPCHADVLLDLSRRGPS